ncbi:hypothetical protein C8K38_103215 [Rhodococcus sp. OK611]|jgi:hypothetical protein|nr:hypothetical protein C8K38_103215 [Rhodococcus sp. OK611]SNX90159.1 hypothetical protein SAMN05447004_104215 [Rhodococcus sp. OK270]
MNDWDPLIILVSTVALTAITGYYAYLTRSLASSARTAAEQSRIAAEASLSSVAVAEASVDVQFDVEPGMRATLGQVRQLLSRLELEGLRPDDAVDDSLAKVTSWQNLLLTCRGATVTVHGLKLTYVFVQNPDPTDSHVVSGIGTYYDEMGLTPTETETLPRLCHAGETVQFEVKDRTAGEQLVEIRVAISYSFGNGPVRAREANWTRPPVTHTHEADSPVSTKTDSIER